MNNIENKNSSPIAEKDINYYISLFKDNILLCSFITTFFIGGSLFWALTSEDIYRSSAVLVPSSSQYTSGSSPNMSGITGLGGLASTLTGGGSGASVDKGSKAVKTVESFDFFELLYEDDAFMLAVLNLESKPSLYKAHKTFWKKNFSLFKDRKTGFIFFHGEHSSPAIAQNITNTVVRNINKYIRAIDVEKATKALKYLQKELAVAQSADIKIILATLIESEVRTITLSEATEYFAFEPIQTAYYPEEKIRPHKSRMVMIGSLLGLISTFFIILVLDFFKILLSRRI